MREAILLVGRDQECQLLDRLMREVEAGAGAAAWIEGEPGIGKSTLLDRVRHTARERDWQMVAGHGEQTRERFPLAAFLEPLADVPAAATLLAEVAGTSSAAGWLVPVPIDARLAAVDAFVSWLERLASQAPTGVILDDVQWADEESILACHQLVRLTAQVPVLLLMACRPVADRVSVVRLRRAAVAGRATVSLLAPLTSVATEELVGRWLGAAPGPGLTAVVGAAGGNPLYLRELMDTLRRENLLATAGSTAQLAGGLAGAVPSSLSSAISRRLDHLSEPVRNGLRQAALLGVEFDPTDLRVVAGLGVDALANVVETALAAGVVMEAGSRFAFRHALIRDALYHGHGDLVDQHRRAARSLATAGASMARIAEQLLLATTVPDGSAGPRGRVDDWAVAWLAQHGGELVDQAPDAATALLASALTGASSGDDTWMSLSVHLVGALWRQSRHAELAVAAARLARDAGDPAVAGWAAWMLASAQAAATRYDEAVATIEAARARRGADPTWSVRLHGLCSLIHLLKLDAVATAASVATAALAEAEQLGDRVAAAYSLHTLSLAVSLPAGASVRGGNEGRGSADAALSYMDRALAQAAGDPEAVDIWLRVSTERLIALTCVDDFEQATAVAADLLRTAERRGTRLQVMTIRNAIAELHELLGQWDESLAELAATELDACDPPRLLKIHGLRALISARRGDRATALAALDAADQVELAHGETRQAQEQVLRARAVLAEQDGDLARAARTFATLVEPAFLDSTPEQHWWLPDIVRVALAAGRRDLAESASRACAAELTLVRSPGRHAALDRCRGQLGADPRLLLAAAERYASVGRVVEQAAALEDAAVLLAVADDARAAPTARAACQIFARVGAVWDLRRAEVRCGVTPSRRVGAGQRRPATGWSALTVAEAAVAEFVAAGHSNPEIAAVMFLSRRTVESHVSSILAKLGAKSRVEVVRLMAGRPPGSP